jgi:uncharacterized protein (DUF934 family)
MALVKQSGTVDDPFTQVAAGAAPPAAGAVIVALGDWLENREALLARGTPLGVRIKSDESPEQLAGDLEHFAVVALEFPKFRDGRAYSYARLLRERYAFKGELRAVGEVLLEQLFFMLRVGFDAFEVTSSDPLGDYRTALADFSVWYQPTADGRPTAMQLRHKH